MTQKTKQILTSLAVLAILFVVYFIWANPLDHKVNNNLTEEIFNNNLDNLQRIEISKLNKATILQKQNDKWVVASEANALADQSLVNNLIAGLKEMETGTIISQNTNKIIDFELTEIQATRLKLYDSQNNLILDILIGKMGPSYEQTYVKKPSSNNVLLVPVNFSALLSATDWKQPAEKKTTNTNAIK